MTLNLVDRWLVRTSDSDLEDILRACVLDFGDQWMGCLPYAELAYNKSHQASVRMAPYEALYGWKYQVPLY
jgi:hypothetical protein